MKQGNKTLRPVYLNLLAFRFPITAIASILHRVSGVVLAIGLLPLLYLWAVSLQSAAGFALVREWLSLELLSLGLWLFLSALFYHALAGIKHLLLDLGWGETQKTAGILSLGVILLSLVFAFGTLYWFYYL